MKTKAGDNNAINSLCERITGRIEQQIEYYATAIGVDSAYITTRVATLLHETGSGLAHSVSTMRENTTGQGGAVEPLALAIVPHRNGSQAGKGRTGAKASKKKRRMSKDARARIGEATRARWAALRAKKKAPKAAKKAAAKAAATA